VAGLAFVLSLGPIEAVTRSASFAPTRSRPREAVCGGIRGDAVIEIEGVTCRYGGGTEKSGDGDGKADGDRVTAVANVTLSIPDGEFLIVAGANGSGKTTLVRTFNGLVTPDSGTVAVNGTP